MIDATQVIMMYETRHDTGNLKVDAQGYLNSLCILLTESSIHPPNPAIHKNPTQFSSMGASHPPLVQLTKETRRLMCMVKFQIHIPRMIQSIDPLI